jgi:3-methyladenine DNA glycosylase/8-oxoguanine DNA glycosylase
MKPQEKAYEIWQKMMNADALVDSISAKQCSLVAVQEIIEKLVELSDGKFTYINDVQYYQEVKQEIENL